MSVRTLRVERAVNELANDLPPGVASEEDVDEHMRRLVEDYGLSVDRAQAATRHYLTATREGVAASLVSQLSRTADTPPTREAIVAELERLETWGVPLGDAFEVIRREHDRTVRTARDRADRDDHADPADPLRGVPRGATDAEVAAAIPGLDDQSWTSEADLADPDPDDHDILDAETRETRDSSSAARPRTASRATIVARLTSTVRTARRWLPGQSS